MVVKCAPGPDWPLRKEYSEVVDALFGDFVEALVGREFQGFCGNDRIGLIDNRRECFWSGLEVEEGRFAVDEGLFDGGVLAVVVDVRDLGV